MKSDIFCRPFTFKAVTKSYSSLMNRYKLGKVVNGRLSVDPYECSFLLITGKIKPEGPKSAEQVIQYFEDSEDFAQVFTIYYALKKAGFYAKAVNGNIEVRKRAADTPLIIVTGSDDSSVEICDIAGSEEVISAIVDMDGDITIFALSRAEMSVGPVLSIGKSMIAASGKRIRIDSDDFPAWLGYTRGRMRFLSGLEYRYVSEKEGSKAQSVMEKVYKDLTEKGLILKSGFKYGADFRAYRSMDSEHAEYLVNTVDRSIEWSRLSRIVRVANAVRKTAILACAGTENPSYVRIRRIKDFNTLYSDQIWASKSSTVASNSE